MGGSPGSTPDTQVDTGDLNQELGTLRDPNTQQNQIIKMLMSGQLSPEEANAYAMSLKATDSGIQNARQVAQQTVREGAASRGLFSSDIALGAEGMALADVENQYAQNRANLYQNMGGTIKQGILAGLQGSQTNMAQRQGLAQNLSNASYQSNSLGLQSWDAQMKNQQAASQNMGKLVGTGLGFALAPMTGGASLLMAGASYDASNYGKK